MLQARTAWEGDFDFCVDQCAPGHFGISPNNTNSNCDGQCPAGFACKNGTANATGNPCLAGNYTHAPGQEECLQCPTGKHSNASRSTVCHDCVAGMWQPKQGETQCLECSPGTSSRLGGQSECQDCAIGHSAPSSGSSSCLACQQGKYSDVNGSRCCYCPFHTTTSAHTEMAAALGNATGARVGSTQISVAPPIAKTAQPESLAQRDPMLVNCVRLGNIRTWTHQSLARYMH